ncbi:cupin domain-containing protein [Amycolatopsis sp. NPDC098790]|uniref:cupin domain-containing protein n=1 Tax=Amycolatopsis sp. NPDC098790 TaxID=3363939 RepID=UPI003830E8D7
MTLRTFTVPTEPCADSVARKLGVFASDRMQAAAWRLAPGQDISARMHPRADGLVVVLAGRGEFQVFETAEPDPAGCYVPSAHYPLDAPPKRPLPEPGRHEIGPGSVGVAPAGLYYGLVNTGDEVLVAVTVTASDTSGTSWTVRAS